jgi:hypothetical protein
MEELAGAGQTHRRHAALGRQLLGPALQGTTGSTRLRLRRLKGGHLPAQRRAPTRACHSCPEACGCARTHQQRELGRLESLVASLRQVVSQSGSSEELFSRLQTLSAPPPPASYRSLAFPVLRQRMQEDLRTAEGQLSQRRAAASRAHFSKVVPAGSRNTLLLLAFSLGFAALAQGHRSQVPVLLETLEGLRALSRLRLPGLRPPFRSQRRRDLARYVEELSRE